MHNLVTLDDATIMGLIKDARFEEIPCLANARRQLAGLDVATCCSRKKSAAQTAQPSPSRAVQATAPFPAAYEPMAGASTFLRVWPPEQATSAAARAGVPA